MADSREMLKIACAALEDKKAFDIKIIDISRISTLCDYIVIADGTNKKQVQALSDNGQYARSWIFPQGSGGIF